MPATAVFASATRRFAVDPPAAELAVVVMIWLRLAEEDATFVMAAALGGRQIPERRRGVKGARA